MEKLRRFGRDIKWPIIGSAAIAFGKWLLENYGSIVIQWTSQSKNLQAAVETTITWFASFLVFFLVGIIWRMYRAQNKFHREVVDASQIIAHTFETTGEVRELLNILVPSLRKYQKYVKGNQKDFDLTNKLELAIGYIRNAERLLHDGVPDFAPESYCSLIYNSQNHIRALSPPNISGWMVPELYLYLVLNSLHPSNKIGRSVERIVIFEGEELERFQDFSVPKILKTLHDKLKMELKFIYIEDYEKQNQKVRKLGNKLALWQFAAHAIYGLRCFDKKHPLAAKTSKLWEDYCEGKITPNAAIRNFDHILEILRETYNQPSVGSMNVNEGIYRNNLLYLFENGIKLGALSRKKKPLIPDFAILDDETLLFPKGQIEQVVVNDNTPCAKFYVGSYEYKSDNGIGQNILCSREVFQNFQEYYQNAQLLPATSINSYKI